MNTNQISEQLLLQVKKQEPTGQQQQQLAALSMDQLKSDLSSEEAKKAFWVNIYNAFFLVLRKEQQLTRPEIYRKKAIPIAGAHFSLDDIEHGILRKYRWKWSLGYLPKLAVSPLIKKLAVDHIDYRIHFALNCGAKSCPPIAFYSPERIEAQLEMATLSFLESETEELPNQKEIHITRLFLWYQGDFGGKKGIRRILQEKLQLDTRGKKLVYAPYNWEEELDNFSEMQAA
jgi:hypothetical protein